MNDKDTTRIYIVIPAFEPDEKLIDVVNEIKQQLDCSVIVVNDGSGKSFDKIFESCKDKAEVISYENNGGKGHALKTAFRAIKEKGGSCVIVTADADGQHKTPDIVRVARAVTENPGRLVMGCRHFTGKIPLRSRFGNSVTKKVYSFAAGVKVSDTQTGLRGFDSSMLDFMCGISGERYEYEMNVLLECPKEGIDFFEVPIDTVYIGGNESSHFDPLKDSIRIYKDIIKFSCSSLLSFFVDYILYTVFILITKDLNMSNILARVISSCFNFTMNRRFVFRHKDKLLPAAIKYFTLAAFILAANTVLLNLLVDNVIHNEFISKIIVEALLFMISWVVQRSVVFKNRKRTVKTDG